MSYQQLTEGKRYQISTLLAEQYSLSQIARKINVHRSTVSRELKRNTKGQDYHPETAHRLRCLRRQHQRKYRINDLTIQFVRLGLENDWSPEQISAISHQIHSPVSHEWIYQYIANDKASGGLLYKALRQGHKRYRRRQGLRHRPIAEATSIDQRPAVVDTRERLGDWEADTVLGKQGSGVLVTLAERKSRLYLVKRVKNKQAAVVKAAIIEMLSPYKDCVHTITFDNGGEFAGHKTIAEALGAKAYFAHPYSSWERGLNENFNGLLRQYIRKGTDLRTISDAFVSQIERKLNARPRKCLGFRQPEVVFKALRQASKGSVALVN
jgi:IS30 family transposase